MPDIRDRIYQAGMNDCVTKPFTPKELYEKIAYNLQNKPETLPAPVTTPAPLVAVESVAPTAQKPDKGINFKKIIEISGGNKAFIHKYNDLTKKAFEQFANEYETSLRARDFDKLRKLNHNIRATVELLDLYYLDAEITKGKDLIQHENTPENEIEASINLVKELCAQYAKDLFSFL
ncbi:MAG: hypothetical protein HC880_08235 [Bacteroidia bacterium]|nr:hypothetical protein [Bacteroidia bacterium]